MKELTELSKGLKLWGYGIKMEREKDKYLDGITPGEWDYWLTLQADNNAPMRKSGKTNWATREISEMGFMSCLFCKTFNRDCIKCIGFSKK
jgi:hypothetical protein